MPPNARATRKSGKSTRKKAGAAGNKKRGARSQNRTARRKTAGRGATTRTAASRGRGKQPSPRPSRLATAATAVRGAAAGAVSAIAGVLPWTGDQQDPIALLEADHRRFENLLKEGEQTTARAGTRRSDILETLFAALALHELIEEKILYPALKQHAPATEIVLEGYQEHHVADVIVKELRALATSDERWGAKFKVLKENLEHHIEEEEGEMFRTARAVFSREELHDMGVRMRALRAEHGA